jgi:tetratricopeptide (TPR) repeat protein
VSGRAILVSAFVAASWLCASVAAADGGLWEEVAQPHRRECAKLIDEAARLRDARELTAAVTAARKAADLCVAVREVQQTAGEVLLAAHEFAEGRRCLERARTLSETSPRSPARDVALAFHLGFAREVTGDLGGAIEEHRRLERMGGMPPPNQYLGHYNLGDELMAVGRLTDAIDEYRRAVALASDKPVVRLALAVALDRDERLDESRAELAIVLAQDPQLKRLSGEEYVFVPAADAHYYRALALLERGWTAEARLALRTYLADVPAGPYSGQARRRLATAEHRVDARELEASAIAIDKALLARALAPAITGLEDCLPAGRVVRVRFGLGVGTVRTEPGHPAAECLDRVLSHLDRAILKSVAPGAVIVPLAGRRAAASQP